MDKAALRTERLVNRRMTNYIIDLHNNGYTSDFCCTENKIFDREEDRNYSLSTDFSVQLIDRCFDQLRNSLVYIYAVETHLGKKGLFLSESLIAFSAE